MRASDSIRRSGAGPVLLPAAPGSRAGDAAAVAALLALGCAFLVELVLVRGVPVARDMQVFFLPQRQILAEALREGRLPFWTPLLGTGFPFLANFQSGFLYPPHWAYAAFPFYPTFGWLVVLHLLLGGAGLYVLARRVGFRIPASWLAATSFMLGGYFVSLTNLVNAMQTAAWTPWMAVSLLWFARSPSPGRFGALTGAFLLGFLAGEPQTFLMGAGISLAFALVHAGTDPEPWLLRRRAALGLGGAGVAVAGLAMVQILPTLELVSNSVRGPGLSPRDALGYSLEPTRLVHLLVPNDFRDPVYGFGRRLQLSQVEPWLFSTYLGVVALVLGYHAGKDRARRGEVALWAALAAVGLVLALGPHTPVLPWLLDRVPGLAAFRYPEKWFLLTAFAAAMLCAHGSSAVLSGRRWRADAVLGVALVALACAAWVFWKLERDTLLGFAERHLTGAPVLQDLEHAYAAWSANLGRVLLLLVLAVALIWLHGRGVLRARAFVPLVSLLLALDFWAAHRHLTPVVDRSFYERVPDVLRTVPPDEVRRDYRYRSTPFDKDAGLAYTFEGLAQGAEKWYWQQILFPSAGAPFGILMHEFGDAIHLKLRVDEDELFGILDEPRRWRLLRLASVKWVFSPYSFEPGPWDLRTPLDSVPGFVYRVRDPLPRAYLARGDFHPDHVEALNAALDAEFDPASTVALVADDAGVTAGPLPEAPELPPVSRAAAAAPLASVEGEGLGPVGDARIISDTGEEVRVMVRAARPGYLVLTDVPYPGWTAHADGEERPILRANYFYRAVPILPGDREVVFRYRSRPFVVGAWISLASLVLFAGVLTWWARRERRRVAALALRRLAPTRVSVAF